MYKLARFWFSLKPTSGWVLFLGVFLGGMLHPYAHFFWLGIFQLGIMVAGWFLWKMTWWKIDDHWHTQEALGIRALLFWEQNK